MVAEAEVLEQEGKEGDTFTATEEEDMALSRILGSDELFIGGLFTLRRKSLLASTGITHVISVLRYDFKEYEDWEKYEHLGIEVDDVEDENILVEFERSGAFIEEALKKWKGKDGRRGKVLVHCAMGKSRSATICIAYLLRQYPAHTVSSALELIREARPMAEPNPGFMAQLRLYREMGCPRDIEGHAKYQRWVYQREVGDAVAAGMAPERVRFRDEEEKGDVEEEAGDGERQVELRCRICRKILATTPYLITHFPPAPPASSSSSQTSNNSPPPPSHTLHTHHFLHPLSWMRPTLSQGLLSGRLECPNPKCSAQIGRYAWQGMKCSCGTWVCPAFSLGKGRVDEVSLGGSRIVAREKGGVRSREVERKEGEGEGKDGFRVADARGVNGAGSGKGGGEGNGIRYPPGMKRGVEKGTL